MVFGIFILFSFLHPENAELPIVSNPSGKDTLFSIVHPANADPPISLTDSGISTFSIELP